MSAAIQNESTTRAIEKADQLLRYKRKARCFREQQVLNPSIEKEQVETTLHIQRLQEIKESAELDQMLFFKVHSILGSFIEIEESINIFEFKQL